MTSPPYNNRYKYITRDSTVRGIGEEQKKKGKKKKGKEEVSKKKPPSSRTHFTTSKRDKMDCHHTPTNS